MSEPAPAPAPSILHPAFLSIKISQSAASRPPPVPSADSLPPAVDPDSSELSADSVPPAVAKDSSELSADSVPPPVAQDSPSPPGPPSKPPAATPLPYSNSPSPPSRTSATPPPISPPLPPPPPVSPVLPPPPPPPPPPKPLSPPPVSPPPKYSSSPPPPPPKTEVSVPPPHSTPPPPSPPPALSPPLISPPDSNAPPSPTPASVPPPPISKIVPPPPPDGQGLLAPPPPPDGQGLLAPPPPPDGQGLLAPPPPVLIIPPSSPTPPPPVSPPSTSTISTPPPLKPTHITPSNYSRQASSSNSSNSKEAVARVGVTIAVAVVAFVAVYFLILRKKWRRTNGFRGQYQNPPSEFMPPSSGESPYGRQLYSLQAIDPPGSKSWFSYEELLSITNKFSNENHIGEGGFGSVYKGVLPDGRQVAVKQLRSGSGQGEREFRAEVEIISRVHHRHLVSLVGYCIVEHHRLLVYEYVPNETLHHHLHGEGLPVLDWVKRMRIAIGSARGLAYLHEDCHPRIIHRDIKSSNILLDENFEAQVADFGLAKLTNDKHTHVTTRVMGTFGYLAPEYASSGKLTDRSDVYSFGVVLLELITGRKPVDASLALEDESLVEWARPLLVHALETGKLEELVDPKLQNSFSRPEMLRMIEAAAACVRHSAPKRPRMVQVLRALDEDGSLADLSNGVKFGQSTIYDSTQYSADIQNLRLMAFHSSDDADDSEEYDRRTVNSSRILDPR